MRRKSALYPASDRVFPAYTASFPANDGRIFDNRKSGSAWSLAVVLHYQLFRAVTSFGDFIEDGGVWRVTPG